MQKDLWEKEYKENRNWPSSYRTEPSKTLVEFFTEGHKVSGPALDIDERKTYANEVVRLLRPGGYFIFYTISADSSEAIRLFKESPAKEKNSYIIRENGMVEHAFTKQELLDLFSPLKFVKFKSVIDETKFEGKVYQRSYYSGVMTK